jgi:hypothetical protein
MSSALGSEPPGDVRLLLRSLPSDTAVKSRPVTTSRARDLAMGIEAAGLPEPRWRHPDSALRAADCADAGRVAHAADRAIQAAGLAVDPVAVGLGANGTGTSSATHENFGTGGVCTLTPTTVGLVDGIGNVPLSGLVQGPTAPYPRSRAVC